MHHRKLVRLNATRHCPHFPSLGADLARLAPVVRQLAESVINRTAIIAGAGFAYASSIDNRTLAAKFAVTPSDLQNHRDAQLEAGYKEFVDAYWTARAIVDPGSRAAGAEVAAQTLHRFTTGSSHWRPFMKATKRRACLSFDLREAKR